MLCSKTSLEQNLFQTYQLCLALLQTKDGRLKIFQCDFFKSNSNICGKFHGVWDRGSLVAIPPTDRNRYGCHSTKIDLTLPFYRYGELMKQFLHPKFVYLLDTMDYDQSLYPGPPLSVPPSIVQQLFGMKAENYVGLITFLGSLQATVLLKSSRG